MYFPPVHPLITHAVWRLGRLRRRPMTHIVRELLRDALARQPDLPSDVRASLPSEPAGRAAREAA